MYTATYIYSAVSCNAWGGNWGYSGLCRRGDAQVRWKKKPNSVSLSLTCVVGLVGIACCNSLQVQVASVPLSNSPIIHATLAWQRLREIVAPFLSRWRFMNRIHGFLHSHRWHTDSMGVDGGLHSLFSEKNGSTLLRLTLCPVNERHTRSFVCADQLFDT